MRQSRYGLGGDGDAESGGRRAVYNETNKSSDEEEYASPLIREDGRPAGREAERLSEGRNAEGSFRAGSLNGYAI